MTRTGKIARLPRALRDKLNRRLRDGESGKTLLTWLNAQPAAQKVLKREFAGTPVSKQNLSEWRQGGFAEWQTHQDLLAQAAELAADAREVATATEGRLSDHLATLLAARYAAALAGWNGEPTEEFRRTLGTLRGVSQDLVELRRGDHSSARLRIEQTRLEFERRKVEAFDDSQVARWAKDPRVLDLVHDGEGLTDDEVRRRIAQIYGRDPDAPRFQPVAVSQSNPVQPSQTTFPEDDPELEDEDAAPTPRPHPTLAATPVPSPPRSRRLPRSQCRRRTLRPPTMTTRPNSRRKPNTRPMKNLTRRRSQLYP